MYEYYKEEIERIQNSIKVTTNEAGLISVDYQPQTIKEDHQSLSAMLDCAYKQLYSFSLIKTIYNAIFNKTKVTNPTSCTCFADWMSETEHAYGTK